MNQVAAVWLEEVELSGAAQAVCEGQAGARAFRLQGELTPGSELCLHECFLVAACEDAEPGDWVIWSHGNCASLALAEVSEGLDLQPLDGFLAPQVEGFGSDRLARAGARIEGVVIARLRPASKAQ